MFTKRNSGLTLAGVAAACGVAVAAPVAAPLFAQSNGIAILDQLAKGEWTVRYRDGSPTRKICLRSGEQLIKLRHRGSGCSRFVIEESANRVTVQYTCPGNGYGRTNIRRESSTLVQIESQGIASKQPFQFGAEARRTGSC